MEPDKGGTTLEKTQNPMGVKPVLPLLLNMAFPPMLSMLIQSLYNIVDSMFVARLSGEALTAVSLAFPLQNAVLAVAVGTGVGVNACVSKYLGAGDRESANRSACHGLLFTALHSVLFILVGLFLSGPFLSLYTQDPVVYEMGLSYSRIVITLSFGSLFHILIEKILQATGNMVVPMIMQGVGALTNIILDPVMIFGWGPIPAMGVSGAAIATIIGQFLACALSFWFFWGVKDGVRFDFSGFALSRAHAAGIYGVALPSTAMNLMPSVLVSILNAILAPISQAAVAVLGLYFKTQTFVNMPTNGMIQAMRPIIGYNYGARLNGRLHQAIRCGLGVAALMLGLGSLLFMALPGWLLSLFDAQGEILSLGVSAFRLIGLSFILSTLGIVFSGAFEALGQGAQSLAISLLRQLLIIPALSLLLIPFMGLNGMWITFPIAEAVSSLAALFIWKQSQRKLGIAA